MYIAIKNNEVIRRADSVKELNLARVRVTPDGEVVYDDRVDTISYNMNVWTMEDARQDFINTRLARLMAPEVQIYKTERIN